MVPLFARIVTVRLGQSPDEQDEAAGGRLESLLNDLAGHGNAVGVTLAVSTGRDVSGRLVRALNGVSSGLIGNNFEPTAFIGAEQSPIDMLRSMGTFAAHIVARDATRSADGFGTEMPVSRGEVLWDELLSVLQEINYGGWLTVDRTQGDDRAGDAGRAIKFLQSLDLHRVPSTSQIIQS